MHSNSYYHSTALSLYSTPSGLARVRMTARRVDAVWTAEESEHEPPGSREISPFHAGFFPTYSTTPRSRTGRS